MTARVSWISLTPVKALALDLVEETEVLESGLSGDRLFFLIDGNDRLVNAKGHGPLQTVRAAYDDDARKLTLRFADGAVLSGPIEPGAAVVTSFHRTPKPGRVVPGPWDEALSSVAGLELRLVEPDLPAPDRGRGGAATLLGAGSLAALAAALGVDVVDPRRFRMNFGVEGPEAHAEDAWLGRRIRVGEAVVVPQGNVGRCAITTQDPDTGIRDLDTLGALADYRAEVETTEPLPFGIHAAVAEPGRVRRATPSSCSSPGNGRRPVGRGVVHRGRQVGHSGLEWGQVDRCCSANTTIPSTRRSASRCLRSCAGRSRTGSS